MNYRFDLTLLPGAVAVRTMDQPEADDERIVTFCWPMFLAFCESTSARLALTFSRVQPSGHFSVLGRCRVRANDGALLLGLVTTLKIQGKTFVWQWENNVDEAPAQAKVAADQLATEASLAIHAVGLRQRTTCDLILAPWPASIFVHEAVGHLAEADNLLALERPVLPGSAAAKVPLTVIDDPSLPGTRTIFTRDDEGNDAQAVPLIIDGLWHGILACSKTARRLPSEFAIAMRGRRSEVGRRILPRQSNTFLLPQATSLQDMVREVRDGFLVIGGNGGGSAGLQFFVRPVVAQRILDGVLVDDFVCDFVLGGDKHRTLNSIAAVGDDFMMFSPFFGCDKDGENQLAVCHGAPSLLLRQANLYPASRLSIAQT